MNNEKLREKVGLAIEHQLDERGYITPVDTLMEVGVLSKQKYQDWRFGRVDYLERVCTTNLSKLSLIMRELRTYARKHGLKPSYCFYKQYGLKSVKTLRFSKSGDPAIEKLYATHFVDSNKVAEIKAQKKLNNG